jgi:porin
MFGDWGGARASLANKGVTFDFASMNDLLIDMHRDLAKWSGIRGTIDIDLEKADLVRGLSFHITALWQAGGNLGGYIGSFANPSNLVSTATIRLDSWWLALNRDRRKIHP